LRAEEVRREHARDRRSYELLERPFHFGPRLVEEHAFFELGECSVEPWDLDVTSAKRIAERRHLANRVVVLGDDDGEVCFGFEAFIAAERSDARLPDGQPGLFSAELFDETKERSELARVAAGSPGDDEHREQRDGEGGEQHASDGSMTDPLDAFPAFVDAVRARLEAGRAVYGDRSFDRPTAELIGELQQEALDLAGWGFVLWTRLEALEARASLADGDVEIERRPVRGDW
jgi:hypothetical protein